MSEKIINVAYIGVAGVDDKDPENELILRIFAAISNSSVRIVIDPRSADFILAYPYGSGSIIFKFKWFAFQIIKKFFDIQDCTKGLRWILGVGSKPTLFISHENLDRPYWWRIYGELIIKSKIPRLTYWPKDVDAGGVRFPYWYNYAEWKDYPRSNFYTRFGKLYNIEELMSPLKKSLRRIDQAILIASQLDFPRASLLQQLKKTMEVKIFGRAGSSFVGGKYQIMKNYKYAFCCENSIGFGYDSEKIPEAWVAGCIPCGVYLNPYSDFNPSVLNGLESTNSLNAYRSPLLLNAPNLIEIEEYVKIFVDQYGLGNADLSRRAPIS